MHWSCKEVRTGRKKCQIELGKDVSDRILFFNFSNLDLKRASGGWVSWEVWPASGWRNLVCRAAELRICRKGKKDGMPVQIRRLIPIQMPHVEMMSWRKAGGEFNCYPLGEIIISGMLIKVQHNLADTLQVCLDWANGRMSLIGDLNPMDDVIYMKKTL